jgi:hypothetical protein
MPQYTYIDIPLKDGTSKRITFDTDIRITYDSVNNKCSSYIYDLKTIDRNSFLSKYKIQELQTQLASNAYALSRDTINGYAAFRWDPGAPIQTYIKSLQNTDIPILKYMVNCIEESVNIPDNRSEYIKAKEALDVSKKRLEMILNPENHVSYYEGWFPMSRPMHEYSLFILFGIALFLLLLSVVLFIRTQGIQVNITTSPAYDMGATNIYETVKGYILYIIALGIFIGYLVHIYTKK